MGVRRSQREGGRFSPAGSGVPAYGSRDPSASENLALKCVPCYNTRRHRNSVFRLLLHRREPDCKWDTPERFAEQGNWVQLPDTFPGQGEVPPESVAVSIEWLPFLRKQVTGGL